MPMILLCLLTPRLNSKETLELFCQKWEMQTDLAKTKVIVFMNGGKVSSKEKLLYKWKTIDIVTHYTGCPKKVLSFENA